MQDYYNHPYVSHSRLIEMDLQTRPTDYVQDYTKAFRRGSIIDAYVTQPSKLDELQPSAEETQIGQTARSLLYADPWCREILNNSIFQSPFYNAGTKFNWEGVQFQLDTKRLYDGWLPLTRWGWDLKSTQAKTQAQFVAACEHFGYWRSRAWYMLGSGATKDLIIGINPECGKLFKVFIQYHDSRHLEGIKQYSQLAFKYWATL